MRSPPLRDSRGRFPTDSSKTPGVPGAGPAFIYTTRDRNTGSSNPQNTYGAYRTDWTPKPAAYVMEGIA